MKVRRFLVEGRGYFPLDMLRYDQCWPCSSEDVLAMDVTEHRRIVMLSHGLPTVARWNSFGWKVEEMR